MRMARDVCVYVFTERRWEGWRSMLVPFPNHSPLYYETGSLGNLELTNSERLLCGQQAPVSLLSVEIAGVHTFVP